MAGDATLEVLVTEQGLVVPADELDKIGAHPGDRVVVVARSSVRPRRMLGVAQSPSGAAFSDEDLRQLRGEMGSDIGDDLAI